MEFVIDGISCDFIDVCVEIVSCDDGNCIEKMYVICEIDNLCMIIVCEGFNKGCVEILVVEGMLCGDGLFCMGENQYKENDFCSVDG